MGLQARMFLKKLRKTAQQNLIKVTPNGGKYKTGGGRAGTIYKVCENVKGL